MGEMTPQRERVVVRAWAPAVASSGLSLGEGRVRASARGPAFGPLRRREEGNDWGCQKMENRIPALGDQVLDVHRDSADFRDLIYRPALTQLRDRILPERELLKVRDQEGEGACTGFALAAVIDYLNGLRERAGVIDHKARVSTRMLYEVAKKHDRWPGEDYDGSSARGAMKGWHKHGVCAETEWPYRVERPGSLTSRRQQGALRNPLGAYYRVHPRRVDLQAALNEVEAVLVTAQVHAGWNDPSGGVIPSHPEDRELSGHAFAVLGYTEDGFLIQNSWGESWGGFEIDGEVLPGVALWSFPDFDRNVMDIWVARMARPVESIEALALSRSIVELGTGPERVTAAPPAAQIRGQYLHIDDGRFDPEGDYPSSAAQARENMAAASDAKHVVLWAHGGLNSVKAAARRVGALTPVFEANDVYGLHYIWETGLWGELRDILFGKQDFARERAGGPRSSWWDRQIEKAAWLPGRSLWREILSDAEMAFDASSSDGGARPAGSQTLDLLKGALPENGPRSRLHLVGHSAGGVWLAHLLRRWHDLRGPRIENLILFAPACTHELFLRLILPRLQDHTVERCRLFVLADEKERDDTVALIYRKSLLYLVANSFEKTRRELNGLGVPLLGLAKDLEQEAVAGPIARLRGRFVVTMSGRDAESQAAAHGKFDNDRATMNSMLSTILGGDPAREFSADDLDY